MRISVVIPTHNRPDLVLEAARSVAAQTYKDFEVIVIDDGSTPPTNESALLQILGDRITLIRHDVARGVPGAKNAGIRAARGEVVMLLDDDDLLRPNALETIFDAFAAFPHIDCLFLSVQAFGPYASGPNRSRRNALESIFLTSKSEERDGIHFFSGRIFESLLSTVPIDFQRPAARRGAWNIIGEFDENSLFSESTWSIRAAAICRIALTKNEIYEWRIHDSNFGWPANLTLEQIKVRQIENELNAGINLLRTVKSEEKLWQFRSKKLIERQSRTLFSAAYYLRDKAWLSGMQALWKSFFLSPSIKHLKLALKYFLPMYLLKKKSCEDIQS